MVLEYLDPITGTPVELGRPGAKSTTAGPQGNPGPPGAQSYGIWRPFGELGVGGRVDAVSISPGDPNRWLVTGDELGVALSENAGESWDPVFGLNCPEAADITWHPTDPRQVWIATMGGPYKSNDAGRTWTLQASGMATSGSAGYFRPVTKIIYDPTDTAHLKMWAFAGSRRVWKTTTSSVTGYGKVWYSTNGGTSWTLKGTPVSEGVITDAAVSSDGASMLVTGYAMGLWRSTNQGATWTPITSGLPADHLVGLLAHPVTAGTYWLTCSKTTANTAGGVYKSTNGGTTWASSMSGLPQEGPDANSNASSYTSVICTSDGSVLLTSDGGNYNGDGSRDINYKSVDGGATWTNLFNNTMKPRDTGCPAGVAFQYAGCFDPNNNNVILIGTSDELYRTFDGGLTWDSAGTFMRGDGKLRGRGYTGWVTRKITMNKSRKGITLLQSNDSGGLLRTDDGGSTFTAPSRAYYNFGGGMDSAFAGTNGSIAYAVLAQGGKYRGVGHSTDYGATWTWVAGAGVGLPAMTDVTVGGAISSTPNGIRATSVDGLTVLLTLGGVLYKSTNGAATWTAVSGAPVLETLAVDPNTLSAGGSTTTVYAASRIAGVYKSTNGGTTWTLTTGTPVGTTSGGEMQMTVDTLGRLLLASWQGNSSTGGGWRLDGATWTHLVLDTNVRTMQADPYDPTRIAYGSADGPHDDTVPSANGVFLSTNDGATFTQQNVGLTVTRVNCLAWDHFVPGRLVIGTEGRGFWSTRFAPGVGANAMDPRTIETPFESFSTGHGQSNILRSDDPAIAPWFRTTPPGPPVGVTWTGSPFTYTSGSGYETLYIGGGTVSSVTIGGVTVGTGTNVQYALDPHDVVVITASSAPTINIRKR